jgi:PAS domain S-box-containing protein
MRSLIFILVLPLFLLIASSFGLLYYHHSKAHLQAEADKAILKTTQYLVSQSLIEKDNIVAGSPVNHLKVPFDSKNQQQVDMVLLLELKNQKLIIKSPQDAPLKKKLLDWFELNKTVQLTNKSGHQARLLDFSLSGQTGRLGLALVPGHKDKKYFWAAIIFPKTLKAQISQYFSKALGLSAIFFLMGLMLSTLLARILSHPMFVLSEAANNLAKGDLKQPIKANGCRELKSLASHLDLLRITLAQKINTQAKTIKALNSEISQRRKAEKTKKENEAYFRSLIKYTSDIITVISPKGVIYYSSPALTRILGYSPEELDGVNLADLIKKDDMPGVYQVIQQALSKPGQVQKVEVGIRHKNGAWIFFESRGISMTDPKGEPCLVINSRDITERKETEKSLQKAYEQMEAMVSARTEELMAARDKLDSIIHTVPDVIFRMDKKKKFTFVSQAVRRYGYDPEEMLGKYFLDYVHPDDQAHCMQAERDREAFGKALVAMEARFCTKNGDYVPLEVYNSNLDFTDDSDQELKSVSQGIARDITERKIVENALRESEEKYATVVENASDALVIIQDEHFIFVNKAFSLMTGYEIEELKKFRLDYLAIKEHKEKLLLNYQATLRGENKHRLYPMKIKNKNNQILEIEVAPLAIPYQGRTAVLAILRDISSRKKAEELRLEKEKLKAAIETAGAICHELNQPLQTVLGHTELILMESSSEKEPDKRIVILNKEAQRMSQITKKLQNITSFETKHYLGDTQILDLGKSSDKRKPQK